MHYNNGHVKGNKGGVYPDKRCWSYPEKYETDSVIQYEMNWVK